MCKYRLNRAAICLRPVEKGDVLQDQFYSTVNSDLAGVKGQVIVFGVAPLLIGIIVVCSLLLLLCPRFKIRSLAVACIYLVPGG